MAGNIVKSAASLWRVSASAALRLRAAAAAATVSTGHGRRFASGPPAPLTAFTEEEQIMRETVSRFARDKIQPRVRQMDDSSTMDKDIIKGLFEHGLMGIDVDTEYGGSGSTFFASIIAIEELARVDASVSVLCDVQNTLISGFFKSYASKELKDKYLPRITTDLVGSYCLSEPSCGSDAFALKASAKRDGDHWVLNGEKAWITNAEHAGFFIVMANIDFDKGFRGITAFVVDSDAPGLSLNKKEDKLGIRASSTCTVFLEDVRVHESQVIGDLGKGYKYAIEVLNTGRIGIAAQMIGVAKGAYGIAVPYSHGRMAFGQPTADFQAMQHLRATLATDIEAASLLVYNAARLRDCGLPFIKEAAMAKYYSSEVANNVAGRCVEIMGGVGFIKDSGIEKFFRDAKIGQIYEGSSFIQLNTIAKCLDEEFSKQ